MSGQGLVPRASPVHAAMRNKENPSGSAIRCRKLLSPMNECRGAVHFPDDGISADRTSDVFEVLLAQIGELNPDLASDLIVSSRRDADAAGFCDALQLRPKCGCLQPR